MITLHFTVRKDRPTTNGKFPIFLAITKQRFVSYIKTDVFIDDIYQFDDAKRCVCFRKDQAILNKRLVFLMGMYRERLDAITNVDDHTCTQIKYILEQKKRQEKMITLHELIEERIIKLEKEGRKSYADMNRCTIKLIDKQGIGSYAIKTLDHQAVNNSMQWLQQKKYSGAYIQMQYVHLKAAINEAMDGNLVKYETHPFKKIKVPKSRIRLMDITVDEFIRIREFKTKYKGLNFGKNLFLLSFYLCGINFADLVNVQITSDMLIYERKKTLNTRRGEKAIGFTIQPEAMVIINKYKSRTGYLNFGYKSSYKTLQRYLDRCLKALAKEVGIKTDFSYYSARKTFAQFGSELGVNDSVIKYCIGHSVENNDPLYNYIRVKKKQADRAIRKIIDYTIDPKKFDI